jgi:hypothetical protein
MKVKFYVNWHDHALLTEEEYEARVKEAAKDIEEEDDTFSDFLAERYSPTEIFDFEEKDKARVCEEFREWCEETIKIDLGYVFEIVEKEV